MPKSILIEQAGVRTEITSETLQEMKNNPKVKLTKDESKSTPEVTVYIKKDLLTETTNETV